MWEWISKFTLLGMWLFIHAGIRENPCLLKRHRGKVYNSAFKYRIITTTVIGRFHSIKILTPNVHIQTNYFKYGRESNLRYWRAIHPCSKVIGFLFAMAKNDSHHQCIDIKIFMFHYEVFCIYCGKYHESMIHRHTWVNIQNMQSLKKRCENTSS